MENEELDLDSNEFLDNHIRTFDRDSIQKGLIEFAKLHVKAALEAVNNNESILRLEQYGDNDWYIDNERVINSYPLDNIK